VYSRLVRGTCARHRPRFTALFVSAFALIARTVYYRAYYPGRGRAGQQRWEIPSLTLAFTATLTGGSRSDCESWFILLGPLHQVTH
jgi:hypothetical protein